MKVEIKNEGSVQVIVITLPVSKRASKTGKSTIVAGTNGFAATAATIDGHPVKVSVNCII